MMARFFKSEWRLLLALSVLTSLAPATFSSGQTEKNAKDGNPVEAQIKRALDEKDLGKREAELNQIKQTIPASEVPTAIEYLNEQGQTGMHSLFNDLCSRWGSADARAAIAWATNLPAASARKSALMGIFCGWIDSSPAEATESAATLSADNFHDDVILAMVNSWSFKDAGAAAEWVSHLPKGKLRDQAIGPVIFWGHGAAPAAVAQMLDTIGDDDLTRQHGEELARIWLTRDDMEATLWIKRSPLSESVKEELLNPNQGHADNTPREKFEKRLALDRMKYTQDQLDDAEKLYQVANNHWGSPEAIQSLQTMVKKYPDINRTGCAVLYLAQMAQGKERAGYLDDCIKKYGDCFYGDGVQVGAYARFLMAEDYKSAGNLKQAKALFDEIKVKYTDAVDHDGKLLTDSIKGGSSL